MGIFFQGVNTRLKDGRRYQVGKRYERNGDTFRANRDGSFTNERTGITFAGSSRSSKVKWFSDERRKSKRVRGPMTGGEGIPMNARAALAGGGSGPGVETVGNRGGSGVANPVVSVVPGSGGLLRFDGKPVDRSPLIPTDKALKRIGIGGNEESLGAISDVGWARTRTGWTAVPSSDVKERIEDDIFQEIGWQFRNTLAPMFFSGGSMDKPNDGWHRPSFLDEKYSHYVPLYNEWREGGSPRRDKNGRKILTGGGF